MISYRAARPLLILTVCTLVLGGCAMSAAVTRGDDEGQMQGTAGSEGIESPSPETTAAPTASLVSEPTPEPLYYTMDGEEYQVILNMTDFDVYSDFKDLEDHSDLVVIGRFIEDAVEKSNAHTNAFEITQVLKGSSESDVIRIYQRYTVRKNTMTIVAYSHLTPMENGSEWICFLKRSNPEEPLYYHVGDTMGRYPLQELDQEQWRNGEYSAKEIGMYETQDFRYDVYQELLKEYDISFE